MRVDFVNKTASVSAELSFEQMSIMQEALQAQYQAIVTDPSQTNTADTIQNLEDLAVCLGLGLDKSCDYLEQNAV